MVVKELHGILELVSCDYVGDNIYITYRLLDHRGVTVAIEIVVNE